ncbi:unnamed protein product [Arabidopsis thaliana]|uniref:(thale cress) hypothetical protein n=1 Tax=Arabidopsis thaliana TaxID=3702 RepID=A0A7G2FGR0_ARATH|nr:unnamed protein product [Arabidopsis thaliana]
MNVDIKTNFDHRLSFLVGIDNNIIEDMELLGLEDSDNEERLSDISDSCLSMGTETDGSMLTLFPETSNPPEMFEQSEQKDKANVGVGPSKPLKDTPKPDRTKPSRLSISTTSTKALTSSKRPVTGISSSVRPLNRKR